jgi:hypothetical protein
MCTIGFWEAYNRNIARTPQANVQGEVDGRRHFVYSPASLDCWSNVVPEEQYHPSEDWLNPLAELLMRWHQLDYKSWDNFTNALCRALRDVNCFQLIGWIVGGEPAPILSEQSERAALRAALRALERDYDGPEEVSRLTPEIRRDLTDLRQRALQAAENRQETWTHRHRKSITINGKPLTEVQRKIWTALDGKPLQLKKLAKEIGYRADTSRLHRDQLKPMMSTDPPLVRNDKAIGGYYRPDAPPNPG